MSPEGPEVDDGVFARNMALLRERVNMSQTELSKRLNDLGWPSVYQTTISRIEKGDRPVRVGEARMIARALNVELATMMLSAADSQQAGRLATAREHLARAERVIRDGTEQWMAAHRHLEKVVAEVRAQGVEPTDYEDGNLKPATVADELALAIRALDREPEIAVRHGKLIDRAKSKNDTET